MAATSLALIEEYVAEVSANPKPTETEWRALVAKWRARVNIESLLRYGGERGWYPGAP